MLPRGSVFAFNSLKFQVILFLRQKLVERYIGVDGVNVNALGHLDTGRREGGEAGLHTLGGKPQGATVYAGGLKGEVPSHCSPPQGSGLLQESELRCSSLPPPPRSRLRGQGYLRVA